MTQEDLKKSLRQLSRDKLVSAIVLHREDFLPNVEAYSDDELVEIAYQEILKHSYETERDAEKEP